MQALMDEHRSDHTVSDLAGLVILVTLPFLALTLVLPKAADARADARFS